MPWKASLVGYFPSCLSIFSAPSLENLLIPSHAASSPPKPPNSN